MACSNIVVVFPNSPVSMMSRRGQAWHEQQRCFFCLGLEIMVRLGFRV